MLRYQRTKVCREVFPPPEGPTNRKVGKVLLELALNIKKCRKSGIDMASATERNRTTGVGSSHHVEFELAGNAIFELVTLFIRMVSDIVPQ